MQAGPDVPAPVASGPQSGDPRRHRRRNDGDGITRDAAGIALATIAALAAGSLQTWAGDGTAPTWKGGYRYEFDGGRTAGGSPVRVTYDLAVTRGSARGGCLLSASGFQTDERIVCHISGDAKTLTVSFHGYDDGRTVNRYGVAVYKPGQTLLALQRMDSGKLLTRWDVFRPDLPAEAANPGEYFQAQ